MNQRNKHVQHYSIAQQFFSFYAFALARAQGSTFSRSLLSQARSTLEHNNSFFYAFALALAQGSTFSRSLLSLLFPSLIPISL
jgi:hypothetical protein